MPEAEQSAPVVRSRADRNMVMELLAASHRENEQLRALVHLPREPRTSISAAVVTDPLVYRLVRQGASLSDIIVALVEDRQRLLDDVVHLRGIAPRRFTATDGTVMIYRCPDELIPELDGEPQEVTS